MMRFLSRLMRTSAEFDPPNPEGKLQVIGDVHGRHDLLLRLLDRLDPDARTVLVGDYIDRGEESAEVLQTCRALVGEGRAVCLMGNHERMLLDFLDSPAGSERRWLANGGLQTLASFRLAFGPRPDPEAADQRRDALLEAMGEDLADWLRALPRTTRSGNVAVVHAAADPALPLDAQEDRTLLWGHPDFERTARTDGLWIAHGHTIVDAPSAARGRIATDTGAYATGRLTAAIIEDGSVRFETT
ncbi:serine/threonine protein phosphatase I [Oceanicola granulosus HTCC2516]|uniref:Serine/threonine protein phosphatase I n=1 Tax=Oceanicola granulosus (strain ATCC BAA-861 / DSM 15982 / KCTC 12143 / HTCC2516) TaxID=314256 RepID=Q2CJK7_OCEGH|nr:metallophosphoesterase [Oceanicola granulosus]EAR53132.1 serine/threonine protein phosphatase I [Oceanicola granulosus HTCC2516]